MPQHDFDELFKAYPEIIGEMEKTFNSHEFILKLANKMQTEYVEALYAYRHSDGESRPAPFRDVHRELARLLHKCEELVKPDGRGQSEDIFGESQECAEWEKV
jgi:hypothetical protein